MRSFEDDPTLEDLLPPDEQARLLDLLSTVSGSAVALADSSHSNAEPIEYNLETLAWLKTELAPAQRLAGVQLVQFVLRYVGKYRLAANLHHDTTEASFAELQQRNEALQLSESRYRSLSEQLQHLVDEQVGVIKQAQQQLYETARLRSVGQLAAGVAHEINNPIGFIASNLRVGADYLEEISEKLPSDRDTELLLADFRELIAESTDGARRIANIVADLKTFSNIDQAEFSSCDLNALIETTTHLLKANHHIPAMVLELKELPSVMGYPAKLSQAFYNILDNAAKALDGVKQGHIKIQTQTSADSILIVIIDDGCGIPENILPQVFDPFFTTRHVGAGTGLGLTVARDIVTAHQGEILLDSHEGRGTQVTIRLPIS